MKPVVFITRSFFSSFIIELSKSLIDIDSEKRKIILFINDLIFFRGKIYFDIEEKELNELVIQSLQENNLIINNNWDLFIQKLIKSNTIFSCHKELRDYSSLNYESIKKHSIIPNFILVHSDDKFSENLEKTCGVITISKNHSIKTSNINQELMIIDCNLIFEPNIFFEKLTLSSYIVVEDPYILNEGADYLKKLFKCLISSSNKLGPTYIILITKTGEGNKKVIEEIRSWFGDILVLDHYERTFLHDRNIFSNTYWVSADYGFKKKYPNSSTTWRSSPIGYYYPEYIKRLKQSIDFIRKEGTKSRNYLLKVIEC